MADFKDVCEDLKRKLKYSDNDSERAHYTRLSGLAFFKECSKRTGDELNFLITENLENYRGFLNPRSNHLASRTAGIKNLLKEKNVVVDASRWVTKLRFPTEYINFRSCQGKYESCKYNEVTDSDLEHLTNASAYDTVETRKEISESVQNVDAGNSECYRKAKGMQSNPVKRRFDLLPTPQSCKTNECSSGPQCSNTHNNYYDSNRSSFNEISKKQNPTNGCGNTSRNNYYKSNAKIMSESQEPADKAPLNNFKTARDEMHLQNIKKYGKSNMSNQPQASGSVPRRTLGGRRTVQNKFVPPVLPDENSCNDFETMDETVDERLKNIDPKMIELISNEIMHKFKPITWNDIAGLDYAKATIQEAVVWPLLRPDIFTGLRRPPRGILLFGPPGTGKTLIGKCIASQSKSTFFCISASSLTSKWIGDGEKMVRALFAVAVVHQPSVIFIDEIDSLLCQRSEQEHESSRRIKTEFLVQLDGASTLDDERILIVGATNRPQELDEAARRRLVRRLYIPLPELPARMQILRNLLKSVRHNIGEDHIQEIGKLTDGYSGADMECLCREASMEPIRSIPIDQIAHFDENEVRPVLFEDFKSALNRVRASVSQNDLEQYVKWNSVYGSGSV